MLELPHRLPKWLLLLATTAIATSSSNPLSAQTVGGRVEQILQLDGDAAGDSFGLSVSGAGDVNGDGYGDLIVGAPGADPGGIDAAGTAYVYCGRTGTTLWLFHGGAVDDGLGRSVSGAGDVNLDGYDDLIVGAPTASPAGRMLAGSVFIYSGLTGNLIWEYHGDTADDRLGISVSSAGDVDNDGHGDVIFGAHMTDSGGLSEVGSAFVYSGRTGNLLWRFDGVASGDRLGRSVAGAGNVDGDGFDDLIVGAPDAAPGGLISAGSVYVYSGQTGGLLWQFDGAAAVNQLGFAVSGAGDLNDDGLDDLIMGAPLASPGGISLAGSAIVRSGGSGTVLHQFDGTAALDQLGYSVSGAGDVDYDNCDDVLVGIYSADPGGRINAGSAHIYSGRTGALLMNFDGAMPGDLLGFSVSFADHVNQDDSSDFILGSPNADPGGLAQAGSALVAGHVPFLLTSATELSVGGGGIVSYGLRFPTESSGQSYLMLASASGTGPTLLGDGVFVPLTVDTLMIRTLFGRYPSITRGFSGALGIQGEGLAFIGVAPGQLALGLIGRTVHVAAVTRTTGSWQFSSIARALTFVP